jgi:hypothetical protein
MLESTMSTRNGGHRTVPIKTIIASAPFRRGFEEVRAGKPFDYEAYPAVLRPNDPKYPWSARDQWRYERGRQFAYCFPKSPYRGHGVLHEAVLEYSRAMLNGGVL